MTRLGAKDAEKLAEMKASSVPRGIAAKDTSTASRADTTRLRGICYARKRKCIYQWRKLMIVTDVDIVDVNGFDLNERSESHGWTRIKDGLPNHGQQVALITTKRFWSVPDGVPDANVTATGYLAEAGGSNYWAIFGERGMELDSFTHWMPLQNPAVEEWDEAK